MRRVMPAIVLLLATPALADVVYSTQGPFGGFFGLWGPTVSASQLVGARFVPTQDYTLTSLRIWLMNDSPSAGQPMRITLRSDGTHANGSSIPSGTVIAEWETACLASGWNPVQHTMGAEGAIALRSGTRYWVVAECSAPGGSSPVWNFASAGNSWNALGEPNAAGERWQSGGNGAALTLTVEGTPGLPPAGPDIDGNGRVDGFDLGLLLGAWGPCGTPCTADLNADAKVDGFDLGLLLGAWTG
jgi:hypothetical protein